MGDEKLIDRVALMLDQGIVQLYQFGRSITIKNGDAIEIRIVVEDNKQNDVIQNTTLVLKEIVNLTST